MRSLLVTCSTLALSCGGGSAAAVQNRTFYDWTAATSGDQAAQAFEQRYPRLDLDAAGQNPDFLGYTVLLGGVHVSRPILLASP